MKRLACLLLVIFLLMPAYANAADVTSLSAADSLSVMGLFKGTPDGYELEREPTRSEALVMLIRLLGLEDEAKKGACEHPFNDVPAWVSSYVGCAYEKGLTKGRTNTSFDGGAPVSELEYIAFLLRALGYGDGDYKYSEALEFAQSIGLEVSDKSGLFTRGDVAELSAKALTIPCKGGGTILDCLLASGAVTEAQVKASGIRDFGKTPYSPSEIYNMASGAVFNISLYADLDYFTSDAPGKGGSGFFISSDGLAVTNYHVIADMHYGRITTSDGSVFPVLGVVWYDVDKDLAVIQVSRASADGKTIASFPYLTLGAPASVGQAVYALGSPLGLSGSFSAGIVSNVSREISGYQYIQFDAAISSGSSGGVLLNEYCEVIAITSASYTSGQNLNLAAPVSLLTGAVLSGKYESLRNVALREQEASSSAVS
ncbi:MAG: S1C family serine protease, partial [Oscillospiraceae bacterium]